MKQSNKELQVMEISFRTSGVQMWANQSARSKPQQSGPRVVRLKCRELWNRWYPEGM